MADALASPLVKDEPVRIRRSESDDDWCESVVALSSPNGRSVILALYGAVRGANGAIIAQVLPLCVDYEAGTVEGLIDSQEYEVETQRRPT